MSDYKSARYKDGSSYNGHKQYLGGGVMKSCAKCGLHKAPGGFKLRRPWGMCCAECQPKEKL